MTGRPCQAEPATAARDARARLYCVAAVPAAALLLLPAAAMAQTHYALLGSQRATFNHPPVVSHGGTQFVSSAVIDALGLAPVRGAYRLPTGDILVVGSSAPPDTETPALQASLNQEPLGSADVLDAGRARYLSRAVIERIGFRLSFNPLHGLYQLSGVLHRFEYAVADGTLYLDALTPITVRADVDKEDRSAITLTVEGGWLPERAPQDFPADPLLARLAVKSQPELGRTMVFARQPERIGYALEFPQPTAARMRLGNYVALERHARSSSGELGIVLQLGAPVEHRAQLAANPTRLIVDLPGARPALPASAEANVGHATKLSLTPTADGARLTVDLTSRVDYRVLTGDAGGRVIVQLLPHAPPGDMRRLRATRPIMLDAGHGGADPGAERSGMQEKMLAAQITTRLAAELRGMGYTVLETRSDDRFVSLGSRGDFANLTLPHVFVSVHCNTIANRPDVEGAITFIHPGAGAETRRAARLVQQELVAASGAVDRGVREEDFFVTRETVMPSLLVECGFMSHAEELVRLRDPEYQAKLARGIARGIDRFVTE